MAAIDCARESKVGVVATNGQGVGSRTIISAVADISRTCEGTDGKAFSACVERSGVSEGGIDIECGKRDAIGVVKSNTGS